MKISDIRIFPTKSTNGIVAFASCIIGDSLYLGSIAIHEKASSIGYRLTYPTRNAKGTSLNVFHPLNKAFSVEMEKTIIEKYLELTAKTVNHDGYNSSIDA